ncbi:MAG: cupin domain-containing protein [Verrucomicrobiota bacterium]
MKTETTQIETYPNATAFHAGPWSELNQYVADIPLAGSLPGKLWLKEHLGLSGMEISFGAMPPGVSIPFLHKHQQNEELYLFITGTGEMLIDGEVIAVTQGSSIRVSPAATRCWRNTGEEPLVYFVIQAKEGSLEQWTSTDGAPVSDTPVWPL